MTVASADSKPPYDKGKQMNNLKSKIVKSIRASVFITIAFTLIMLSLTIPAIWLLWAVSQFVDLSSLPYGISSPGFWPTVGVSIVLAFLAAGLIRLID